MAASRPAWDLGGGAGAYGAEPGRPGGGACPPQAVGRARLGLRRTRCHADGRRVRSLRPRAPSSRGGDWAAPGVAAALAPSTAPHAAGRRRSLAPSARAARMRLPGLGLGLEREEAEERRRRAACDGELLLDAVLRTPPQGSGAAAARRRVSPGGRPGAPAASRRPGSEGLRGKSRRAGVAPGPPQAPRRRGHSPGACPRERGLPRGGGGTGSAATRTRRAWSFCVMPEVARPLDPLGSDGAGARLARVPGRSERGAGSVGSRRRAALGRVQRRPEFACFRRSLGFLATRGACGASSRF